MKHRKSNIGIIVSVLGAAILTGCGSSEGKAPAGTPAAVSPSANSAPAVSAVSLEKLKGKWLRPDGGYVLSLKSISDTGVIDASYFNPKSIHVAKAEALSKDGVLRVFIELRDVNYPGSTYTLLYNPSVDTLVGIYFQAATKQSFEVVFTRIKE